MKKPEKYDLDDVLKWVIILTLILIGLVLARGVFAATYYIRNDGSAAIGSTTGCSAAENAANVAAHNAGAFAPGDTICFCSEGGVISGATPILPSSGTSVEELIAYNGDCDGDGITASIDGRSTITGSWVDNSGSTANTWYHAKADISDTSLVLFGSVDQANIGKRETSEAAVNAVKDFYIDNVADRIYVYSVSEPTEDVILTFDRYGVDLNGQDYIDIKNIDFKFQHSVGIKGTDVTHINIYDNTLSWIGGLNGLVGNGMQIDGNSSYIYIYNNTVSQVFDAAIGPHTYTDNATLEYVYVYNNTISLSGGGISATAITANNNITRNMWIYGNTITDSGSGWIGTAGSLHGVGITSTAGSGCTGCSTDNINVYNNTIDGFTYRGVGVIGSGGSVNIYNNTIRHGTVGYSASNPVAAIGLHGNDAGTALRDVTGYAAFNVIYDNDQSAISIRNNQSSYTIYNNTTYNSGGASYDAFESQASSADVWKNNLCYAAALSQCINENNTAFSDFDYNLTYAEGADTYDYKGTTYTLTEWQGLSGNSGSTNSQAADPLFLNAASGNFGLAAASPARRAGTDPDGLSRPDWDIGAYQSDVMLGPQRMYFHHPLGQHRYSQ